MKIFSEEPVYLFFQRIVRPLLRGASRTHKRFEHAIHRMADDLVMDLRGTSISGPTPDEMAIWSSPQATYNRTDMDDGLPIERRLAGQILPHIESVIGSASTILEIGSANGALLEYLAIQYPQKKFIGIDFWAPPAKAANVRYVRGYALDLLEPADLVYTNFTAVKFFPIEIDRYFAKMASLGVKAIVMSEPVRARYRSIEDRSVYMDGRMWRHPYAALAERHGYRIQHSSCEALSKRLPGHRARPDTYLMQLVAAH